MSRAPTLLCLASYEKGGAFLREAKERGARVVLLTTEELRDAGEWPRDVLDDVRLMPDLTARDAVLNGVSWLARSERIDRVVALDEFDLEVAAELREHLCLPGMGVTATRQFRDKLTMRLVARRSGVPVPDFAPLLHDDDVREWAGRVPPPWVVKPRSSAATMGIRKVDGASELWPVLDALGDDRSHHLIEEFVPGGVFHVDGVVSEGHVAFAEAHGYGRPPLEVTRAGGMFMSHTLERDGDDARRLKQLTGTLVDVLGMRRGAFHAEFIRAGEADFRFLEIAARVGGAHIADMVEAATGVNLWREWARVEVADAAGESYERPRAAGLYAGILVTLARQEWPDTSGYDAPEIVWRLRKHHHAGLVVASPEPARVRQLLEEYGRRFGEEFSAFVPET